MESNHLVQYERRNHVAIITMKRPEKLNAINMEMVKALHNAWYTFQVDEAARVAIITGEGKAFSTGLDVSLDSSELESVSPAVPGMGFECTKPVIAAINGYCLGIGFAIALFSDIRISVKNAYFAYPEAKIGLTGGGGALLASVIPKGIALEMLFTGSKISADYACEVGFINYLVDKDDLLDKSLEIAEKIAGNAPMVVKALKKLANNPELVKNQIEGNYIISAIKSSEDAQEGLRAISEKRAPDFIGE